MHVYHPATSYSPCVDLWIITTYYNPARYRTKRVNYEQFAAPIRAAGIPFLTVECAYGSEEFELTAGPDILHVRGRDVMWSKERLINLAVEQLPPHVTKVAWIDADILFSNPQWAVETSALLERYPVAQPHGRVGRMQSGELTYTGRAQRSFACQLHYRPESARLGKAAHGQPGIAWEARRDLIARHGLYDAAIIGGGDELFAHAAGDGLNARCVRFNSCAYVRPLPRLVEKVQRRLLRIPWPQRLSAWYVGRTGLTPNPRPDERFFAHFLKWAKPLAAEVQGRIGCVPGMALHLWHGHSVDRQYGKRKAVLRRHYFDPASDLRLNDQGVWEWASNKPDLHREVEQYFHTRFEDR